MVDIIVHFATFLSAPIWWLLLVIVNYSMLAILFLLSKPKWKPRWKMFLSDKYYHAVWILIIPLCYWTLIECYETRNAFIYKVLPGNYESPFEIQSEVANNLIQTVRKYISSPVLLVVSLIASIAIVYIWQLVHRKESKEKLKYWWTTGRELTPPGMFFLFMCVMVVWSVVIFLVNVISDEIILYIIILKGKLKFDMFSQGGLAPLTFITEYLNKIILVCIIGSVVGFVLGYDRSKNQKVNKSSQRDYLIILNTIVTILIFSIVFLVPELVLHSLLIEVRQNISHQGFNSEAVPVWAVDSQLIISASGSFITIVSGIIFVIEDVLKKKRKK